MTEPVLLRILAVISDEIANMWWFFLLSILLVGVIKGYKIDMRIRDAMNRAGAYGVVIAVAIGMISPLCACGILPIVVSLAMIGTPIAAGGLRLPAHHAGRLDSARLGLPMLVLSG